MMTTPHIANTYHTLLDGGLVRDPNSTYWQSHCQAAARKLAEIMGVDQYRAWFDRRFPGETEYTWRARWEGINACLVRLQIISEGHRGAAIARELNIPVDEEGDDER